MLNIHLYFVIIFFIFFNYSSFAKSNEPNIKYEVGKPYKIKEKWYYPNNNLNYYEIGIASVNLNKKEHKTKNGELFSNDKIVAKHKILALPTIVRITNLYNGYSINVRVNGRGPKNNFRIIELSKKTADYLKIDSKGLVEVKVIPDLTIQEQNKLKGEVLLKNSKENLEKNVAIKKEVVEVEDLMKKKIEKIKKKKRFWYYKHYKKKRT